MLRDGRGSERKGQKEVWLFRYLSDTEGSFKYMYGRLGT